MIEVLVNGASGRMGSEVVRSVMAEEGLAIAGAVDPAAAGKDPGYAGHRIQLARTGSPTDRHAAVGARPGGCHRTTWQLPR